MRLARRVATAWVQVQFRAPRSPESSCWTTNDAGEIAVQPDGSFRRREPRPPSSLTASTMTSRSRPPSVADDEAADSRLAPKQFSAKRPPRFAAHPSGTITARLSALGLVDETKRASPEPIRCGPPATPLRKPQRATYKPMAKRGPVPSGEFYTSSTLLHPELEERGVPDVTPCRDINEGLTAAPTRLLVDGEPIAGHAIAPSQQERGMSDDSKHGNSYASGCCESFSCLANRVFERFSKLLLNVDASSRTGEQVPQQGGGEGGEGAKWERRGGRKEKEERGGRSAPADGVALPRMSRSHAAFPSRLCAPCERRSRARAETRPS